MPPATAERTAAAAVTGLARHTLRAAALAQRSPSAILGVLTQRRRDGLLKQDMTGFGEIDGRPAMEFLARYLDVTGPLGTVRVQITDHCPRCSEGLIDVSRTAFAAIAALPLLEIERIGVLENVCRVEATRGSAA